MESRTEVGMIDDRAMQAEPSDFREVPAGLAALMETLDALEQEWAQLARTLGPICAPASDEKLAEELRIGPSSEIAQALSAMEQRAARLRNAVYDVRRRVQL